MKYDMIKNIRFWLILVVLLVVAILSVFWATTYRPIGSLWEPRFPDIIPEDSHHVPGLIDRVRGDIELFYTVKTVISSINITLILFLLVTYINIYQKTQSEFTIGLILFSMILLLYALASNPVFQFLFGFQAYGLGPFAMLPDLFSFFALTILLYLTFKY